jgi:hypothetical protein
MPHDEKEGGGQPRNGKAARSSNLKEGPKQHDEPRIFKKPTGEEK